MDGAISYLAQLSPEDLRDDADELFDASPMAVQNTKGNWGMVHRLLAGQSEPPSPNPNQPKGRRKKKPPLFALLGRCVTAQDDY